MNIKLLTAGLLASLMMAGSTLAMDSDTIEKKMARINDSYVQTAEEGDELKALEEKVEKLVSMIQMIIDDQDV